MGSYSQFLDEDYSRDVEGEEALMELESDDATGAGPVIPVVAPVVPEPLPASKAEQATEQPEVVPTKAKIPWRRYMFHGFLFCCFLKRQPPMETINATLVFHTARAHTVVLNCWYAASKTLPTLWPHFNA